MQRHTLPTDCSRRAFLSRCAACVGCAASLSWLPSRAHSAPPTAGKPKIRLVFCETTNDKPIWPNIGYDFEPPRTQLLHALTEGCPDIQLLPVQVMDKPQHADEVLQKDGEVDGYLVCVQGLGWENDIVKLCSTGKPTLLVDHLFGGSGLFLTRLPQIVLAGKPVDWVSSANVQDVVASARQFGLLASGQSAAEVVSAFRATRRQRTPAATDWTCRVDHVPAPNFATALDELRRTKLLVVGGGWGGDPFRKATHDLLGIQLVPIEFEELAAAYKTVKDDDVRPVSERWTKRAQEVVEPTAEEVHKSAGMYLAMTQLIAKHGARGISINCLGGFYGGHMQAYPCLGFSQLNDDGLVGGCEADQMSAVTMATMGVLVGRPGYISDPVIDTSKNAIVYAHCVAMTKPFGTNGEANPYRIRSHSEDRRGASMQSLLPDGCLTTTLEIDPVSRQVLFHQAKTIGNNPSDLACRTKLEAVVKGDLEKLVENWRMGWHRVTFYGDHKDTVTELCERLQLKLIEEA